MRINPVYKREIMTAVRTPKIVFKLLSYNFIVALITLFVYMVCFDFTESNQVYANILVIYIIIAICEMGLVLFIIPASTAGSIAGEREKQTLDILLTTTLKPYQIILGKLAAAMSLLILLFLSSIPIITIVLSIGGITLINLIQLLFLLFVTAIYIGSIAIFFSTKMKRTVPATVCSYAAVIGLTLGTFLIVLAFNVLNMISISGNDNTQYMMCLLLFNPVVSLVSMMNGQFGNSSYYGYALDDMGVCPSFLWEHWLLISMIVQLCVAVVFILLAIHTLNPIKKKHKNA